MTVSDWHLYVVRTREGALYTGISTDVARRLAEHSASRGKGAKSLRSRGPLELVYQVKLASRAIALRAELRLKRLAKARKEAIVAAGHDADGLLEALAIEPWQDGCKA